MIGCGNCYITIVELFLLLKALGVTGVTGFFAYLMGKIKLRRSKQY